jgi:glycosyltransferase involved in cell wall biosynthesis
MGGPQEEGRLVAGLAALCEVRVLCLRADVDDPPGAELGRAGIVVEEVDRGVLRPAFPLRLVRSPRVLAGWLAGRPRGVTAMASPRLSERIRAVCRDWRPDVVQLEHLPMGRFAADAQPGAVLLRVLEPSAAAAAERAEHARGIARLAARLDAAIWSRFECRALAEVDAVVVLTDADRDALRPLPPGTPVRTIGLELAVPPDTIDPGLADDCTIAFVGNFAHAPNVEAAQALARILTLVRREVPAARLLLVGEGSDRLGLDGPGVSATGRVATVAGPLERAAVVAIPVRTGGGMRVKVFEALAYGKPAVVSPLALRGLSAADGVELLVADGEDEFARALSSLLLDRPRRLALGEAARAWAAREVDGASAARELHALHLELVRAGR